LVLSGLRMLFETKGELQKVFSRPACFDGPHDGVQVE